MQTQQIKKGDDETVPDESFEKTAKELQKKINESEEALFSLKVIQEYRNPTHFGLLENPTTSAVVTGPCGDTMKIMLHIENQHITDASFWTDGCGPTIACGNLLAKTIIGRSIEDVEKLSAEHLLRLLGGLPKDHVHCSKLTVNTLHQAISQYKKTVKR